MRVGIGIIMSVAGLALALWKVLRHASRRLPAGTRPLPGPKGLPIIGNVHQLASHNPWMSFANWAKEYGPIYQVNLGGANHVWISSEQIASDLLSKKSHIYSDRPHIPALLADNRTSGQYLPLMSKNDLWRRLLRFTKMVTAISGRASFYGHPELESIRLLHELLQTPWDYHEHLESFVARVTSRLAWGDPTAAAELKQRARELLISVSPTGHLGNKLPFLMRLPSWLVPQKAWEVRRARSERVWFEQMLRQVRADIKADGARPSWMRSFLTADDIPGNRTGLQDDMSGAYCIGMNGIAGALTIAAPMQGFLLALCLYPKYLIKLHEELDRECPHAPPAYSDMPRLPYLRACIRETLRWRPPVPTGIPHLVTEDDVYAGHFIPKGSVIHPLEWSMGRDPSIYPVPAAWNPERWLDPASPCYKEPLTKHPCMVGYSQFGFGRRICPGQEVSEADMLCGLGAIAWLFDIGKQVDPETGLEVPVPACDYSSLLIAKPRPFDLCLAVRSEERRAWLRRRWDEEADKGSFPPDREFWEDRGGYYGWGETWS